MTEALKPTKHFKLSKQVKRLMASLTNKDLRDHFKGAMIQAKLYADEQARELEKKRNKRKDQE